jgi:catechol 2,3-dioxygenase-like lactoylglutathione lyase family enzyme
MITQIDHIVILVHDLEAAKRDYGALGFRVVAGGEHADGRSRNALVAFSDGSYLELIAFKDNVVPESHNFYRPGNPEGLVTFALLPTDIESDVRAARERGLDLSGPHPGGRLRPDGQRLEWRTATPPSHDLPFLCADVTPRELRVPHGSAHDHPNGATGISALGVVVSDLEQSIERYSELLGRDVTPGDAQDTADRKEVAFWLENALIVLAQPTGEGEPGEYLKNRGEGPYLLVLGAKPDIRPEVSDPALTHGVTLTVVSVPLRVDSVAEEYAYIAGLTCSKCGGHYKVVRQSLDARRDRVPMDLIEIVCLNCGQSGSLYFDLSSFFGKQV